MIAQHLNWHTFVEPRLPDDAPLYDRSEYEIAEIIRQTPRTADAHLFLNIGDERK